MDRGTKWTGTWLTTAEPLRDCSRERENSGPHPGDPDGSLESIFVYTPSHSEGQLSLGDSGTEAHTPSLELEDRAGQWLCLNHDLMWDLPKILFSHL